uniref:Peptidoglycan-recognition protein n=1 Tax=Ostrinia nubilalis TaxID=29057 RepID=E7DN57_OSTNU|nr:peptidoglycan recognition protein B [Ostrinia nubilalis]
MAHLTLAVVIISFIFSCSTLPTNKLAKTSPYNFPFVTKEEWEGRPPTDIVPMETPVPYVVIHHTYIPDVCYTSDECKAAMRGMQNFHQLTNGWADIGYSFAVGGDGKVYEGRGWEAVGAHAVGVNTRSIGIALIGDFVSKLPSETQLAPVHKLIATGVELGYIRPDYTLIGHRAVSATECPGGALFQEISTWPHFDKEVSENQPTTEAVTQLN